VDDRLVDEPRQRRIALPARGGEMAALEFGPAGREVDILFAHANGFNARSYRTILAPLADSLRILAVDLRGHGRTELPLPMEGRTGWTETRDDHLALLETLDLKGVVLAGHSMGGSISLMAAALAPERARAVVLFEPVILAPELIERSMAGEVLHGPMIEQSLRRRAVFADRETAYRAYHGRGSFAFWSDAMLADYVADGFRDRDDGQVELACLPAWEASSYGAQGNDVWGALRESRCPVRVFRAEQASTCRLTQDDAAAIDAARIEVATVPGTNHFLPMQQPELVRQALAAAAR
jgi:pimeloyl-ACP methyl ester carboxylesterase